MEPDLSEFSYGFALTNELLTKFGLKIAGAPEFPTQSAEGKPGGRWDVKLPGVPLYLQFKRSDKMKRRTAQESHKFARLPFYRMHLRRRDVSDQHQLMLDLEAQGKQVFYAAPGFADREKLSECYTHDTVAATSILVRPSSIGPLKDDKKHHVAFQIGGAAYFCSEPTEIETVNIDALMRNLRTKQAAAATPDEDFGYFQNEAEDLLRVFEGRGGASERQIAIQIRQIRDRRSPAEYAGYIARTLFEAELLIVPKTKGG